MGEGFYGLLVVRTFGDYWTSELLILLICRTESFSSLDEEFI